MKKSGFSLIELITAISILSILMVFLSQMVGLAGRSWGDAQRRIDNFTKARVTLDLITRDLQAAVLRPDLGAFPEASNRIYAFYTQRPSIATTSNPADRNLSLIEYKIEVDGLEDEIHLQRADLPVSYATPPGDLSFGEVTNLPERSRLEAREASPGIVAMALDFVYSDGAILADYSPSASNPVRGICVTIAVVDETTHGVLGAGSKLNALSGAFLTIPPKLWKSKLDEPFFFSGYPAQLRAGLRIYERYVTLPNAVSL